MPVNDHNLLEAGMFLFAFALQLYPCFTFESNVKAVFHRTIFENTIEYIYTTETGTNLLGFHHISNISIKIEGFT